MEKTPDVIRKSALKPLIVIHSASTQQIIMVELTVSYESRMEEANAFKKGKYLDLTYGITDLKGKHQNRPKAFERY
ncbi:reverse transcriptase [Plakobranchus ocellatus]|uniref:Reverse transcriptase n=1 Tax=Plakobranchus ocellatus TaxID=259542 RepID=A0AAV3ZHR4_9GAST|nr:reverse transcriptase [Plakobranchus ocellatus]